MNMKRNDERKDTEAIERVIHDIDEEKECW